MDLNALSQKFKQGEATNFAALRLPGSSDIHFFYGNQAPVLKRTDISDRKTPAFICSPYSAGDLAYIFEADSVYINDRLVHGPEVNTTGSKSPVSENAANFFADEKFYIDYVASSVKEISLKKLKKTVAARCKNIPLKHDFDAGIFFSSLVSAYPDACIYYFNIEGTGCWMGATPERLLTVKKGVLETVALAGTVEKDGGEWAQKEKDEQQVTEKFIEAVFKKHKMTGYRKSAVSEVEAGTLKHLVSSFTWKPDKDFLQQKFHKILSDLNPTPAVCGMPKTEASFFISLNEKMERRFYSGFVGMLNGAADTHLYVNLRCMEIAKSNALLYAGAGITPESVGEKEWQETERKMETLARYL